MTRADRSCAMCSDAERAGPCFGRGRCFADVTDLGMTMPEIAVVLGHSKPSTTEDLYSHLASNDKAADLMDGAMGG